MKIEFTYSKKADKFLDKHSGLKDKFEENIRKFLLGDKNINIKEMQGFKIPVYRMRISSYRIIFTRKNGEIIIIYTVDAGSRGDIYNNIKDIKKNSQIK